MKHHSGKGKAALGFGPDRIGTLVSMATDSSYRVMMGGNLVNTLAPSFMIGSSSFLQVRRTTIKSWTSLNGPIRPRIAELAALKSEKITIDLKCEECQHSSAGIFFIGFLRSCGSTIKAWMSLNFCEIPPLTAELAALECLKNRCTCLSLLALKRLHF